jgi:HK97 family phage major capsid protein
MFGTDGTIESDIVDAEDLNNLIHALDPEYRESASWIFNDATALRIENLVDTNARPLLVNSTQGIEGSIRRATLLGYPVVIDQACPNMDSTDDQIGIAFGDLREAYIVRHVRDVQVLVNPYAATGYVVYDAWARMDGKIQNTFAVVTGEGV